MSPSSRPATSAVTTTSPSATRARQAKKSAPKDEVVDLNALDAGNPSSPAGANPALTSTAEMSPAKYHGSHTGPEPSFKVFFDFNLINRPGIEDFSFDNYHTLLLFELLATPEIQFNFEVSSNPRYFEMDYQVLPKLQLRWGKIWIPFDDMAPHNIFGGRVDVSRLAPGAAFLPDLWTDLGVGAKLTLLDTRALAAEFHLYVVNGFRSGGTDLRNPSSGKEGYPSLGDLPTAADNNRDKAIGGRLHLLAFNKIGLGLSYYNGRWNSENQPYPLRLQMYGVDFQLRPFATTEIRAGIAQIVMWLPTDVANRGGMYAELGQKFGSKRNWKILFRGGMIQLDDRVIDVTDQRIVGATLLWQPNMIQYSLEYSQDLKVMDGKKNYGYAAARIVMAF